MARKRASSKRPAHQASAGRATAAKTGVDGPNSPAAPRAGRPSALIDTRVIYCGDCLDQLQKLPDGCVDLSYIDPPFNPGRATRREATPRGPRARRVSSVNSNRNCEVFWGEAKEKRAFEDRHAGTAACIDYMRPRRVEPAASSSGLPARFISATGTTATGTVDMRTEPVRILA